MKSSNPRLAWQQTRLGEVAAPVPNAIADGPFGSNLKLSDYVDEGVPVLQGKNITNDTFCWSDIRFISSRKAEELKRSSVRVGDVLIVKIGSIGYSAIVNDLNGFDFAIIPANLAKITPDATKVDLGYLHKWMTSLDAKRYLIGSASKTAQPALSLEKIKNLPVPLPPLAEQRRIADVLDRAEALRAKRRAALTQLDSITQSIFLDLFGDPATNPKGWPIRTVGELCKVKGGKRLPKGEEYSATPTAFRYIRITDLVDGVVDESALVYLKPEVQAKIARYVVNAGDVIISIAGSIGLIAPVPVTLDGINLTENAAKLVPRDKESYDATYLAMLLQTPFVKNQISSHIGQVTIGKLALFRIEKLIVPLPPISLQHEFVVRRDSVEKLKIAQRVSLREMDALLASLQHRAFRGEL